MNISYDLIIVSKSITKPIEQITQNCINSARADCDLNVILIETGKRVTYSGVDKVIEYREPFNYNHALNLGLAHAKGDVHILANNDIIFRPGWSEIGEFMYQYGFGSGSALSESPTQKCFERGDWIYEGYNVGTHIAGWCIFITKEAIKKIGKLDETFDFWYSDNIYSNQLQEAGIRHGLFCNIQVDHITSVTLRTLPYRMQKRYSFDARKLYMKHAS